MAKYQIFQNTLRFNTIDLPFINKTVPGHKIMELTRFIMTGFIGLLIDFFFTWLFKDYMEFNKYFSNGIGFTFAVINNYTLNRLWTFKSNDKAIARQFSIFLILSVCGLLLSTFFLFLIHQKCNVPFYVSKAIVVVLVFIWNYMTNSLITFRKT